MPNFLFCDKNTLFASIKWVKKGLLPCILVVGAMTTMACKSKQKIQTTTTQPTKTTPPPPLSIAEILNGMAGNALQAEWLSSDAALDYKGKPMNIAASSTWRYRKDSIIWVNVKKLGFPVARILVRRDSIFALNLLQSQYLAKDFAYIERMLGVPANFDLVQDLMLGKPIFLTNKDLLTAEKAADGDWILRGDDRDGSTTKNGGWQVTYRVAANSFLLKEMLFEQSNIGRSLRITYSDYQQLQGANFAYLRTIAANSLETGAVTLEFELNAESMEVDVPKTIRFEIPSHYEKMD
jgi:hypothetical protein